MAGQGMVEYLQHEVQHVGVCLFYFIEQHNLHGTTRVQGILGQWQHHLDGTT